MLRRVTVWNRYFTYTVVNAEGLTGQARVTVTVRGVQQEVNRNPVAKNDTATTGKNNAIKIYVLANDYDTDGDRLKHWFGNTASEWKSNDQF